MVKKKIIASALGLAAMLTAPGIMAQQHSWYVGGTLGRSDYQDIDGDTRDTAWRVLGGYRFHPNFAAELGYHDLGRASLRIPPLVDVNWSTTLWEFVGVGTLPLANQFSVYGKLGFYRAEQTLSGTAFGVTDSVRESNTDLTFAIGGQFDVTRQLGLRLEWQRYSDVGGDNVGGKADIDVLSLGAVWRF